MKHFLFFTVAVFFLSLKNSSQVSYKKFDSITVKTNGYWKKYPEEKKEPFIIRRICNATTLNVTPLYVIDGVIAEEFELKNIDPNDIESIWVLKNNEATALYGCRAASGVILITTKNANQRTIVVKDMLTGEPLAGANIDLFSTERRDETIHLIADSLGKAVINKIVYGKEYELKVSSLGYKNFRFVASIKQLGKNYTVLLERQYETLDEITVKSIAGKVGPRKTICSICLPTALCGEFRCLVAGSNIKTNDEINKQEQQIISNLKLYPNPVMKSQKINIEFEGKRGKVTVRLFSIDHKVINAKEYEAVSGMNRISFSIDHSLASGMYIIQLFDEKNSQLKAERLVIQ